MTRLSTLFLDICGPTVEGEGLYLGSWFPILLDLSPFHMTFSFYLSSGLLLDLISFFSFTFSSIRVVKTEI